MKGVSEFIDFVPAFANQLTSLGREQATVDSYVSDVRLFLSFLAERRVAINDLSLAILQNYYEFLCYELLQDNSLRRKIISIKQFFAYLSLEKKIVDDPFVGSIIPKRDDSLWGTLTDNDLQKVLDYLHDCQGLSDLRNSAIVHLLAFEGIKASELVSLCWQHFFPQRLDGSLEVIGVRRRLIDLDCRSNHILRRYQRQLEQHRSIGGRELIFFGYKGPGSAVALQGLTRHGLKFLLHKLAEQLDIASLSPQRLRHYAIRYLRNERNKTVDQTKVHLGLRRIGNINKYAGAV